MVVRLAELVVGLGFGDEGKGSVVDFSTRYRGGSLVVRFNGGAQAAHNVVTKDGRHHTFSQFGSGTLGGAGTHLSRFMVVNPGPMLLEAKHLVEIGVTHPFANVTVEEGALVTTPFQVAANRLRELARGEGRHGSCGMGVGETMKDSLENDDLMTLRVNNLRMPPAALHRMLLSLQELKRTQLAEMTKDIPDSPEKRMNMEILENKVVVERVMQRYAAFFDNVKVVDRSWLPTRMKNEGIFIFEGAQGVLLDESYGFHPYTTWSNTTFDNALALLEGFDGNVKKLGVTRAFHTRHGAGPFVTESPNTTEAVAHDHNKWSEWQRNLRSGYLDLVALRYALNVVGGVDGLAVTNLDRIPLYKGRLKVCTGYRDPLGSVDHSMFETTSDGEVYGIRKSSKPDLVYQEKLTTALSRMTPVLLDLSEDNIDDTEYSVLVAEVLNTTLVLLSRGPTAEDKTMVYHERRHASGTDLKIEIDRNFDIGSLN